MVTEEGFKCVYTGNSVYVICKFYANHQKSDGFWDHVNWIRAPTRANVGYSPTSSSLDTNGWTSWTKIDPSTPGWDTLKQIRTAQLPTINIGTPSIHWRLEFDAAQSSGLTCSGLLGSWHDSERCGKRFPTRKIPLSFRSLIVSLEMFG